MNLKRRVRILITAIFYASLIVFLALYLWGVDWNVLAELRVDWRYLTLAAITALTFRYWQTLIWITVLRMLGASDVRMNAEFTYVYAKAWLGRYIPGTAPWILGKIYFAAQHGVSKAKLAVGSLLEGSIQIAVLMALSSVLLLVDPRLDVLDQSVRTLMIVTIILSVIALTPPVFNWLVSLAFRLLRRGRLEREHRANWRTILVASCQYAFGAALSGLSLFFLVKSLYPSLGWGEILFVMASGNLAGAAGMLAVFAPGGVGVREGVQLVLLSLILPTAVVVILVVFARIWGVAADLAFFGISRIVLMTARRRAQSRVN